jgi:hypothetical protein
VGRPEGKRLLGRSRTTWEDNIKTNLCPMIVARLVAGAYESGDEPSGSIKCREYLG